MKKELEKWTHSKKKYSSSSVNIKFWLTYNKTNTRLNLKNATIQTQSQTYMTK